MIDETHDSARRSWVASANGHPEFPLQNLPFGVFSPPGRTAPDAAPRGGVAIGDMIFDLRAALEAGLFSDAAATAAEAASGGTLNPLMALGSGPRRALRQQVFALLDADGAGRSKAEPLAEKLLHRAGDCWLHLPASIGNFTDFFAGIHHATNGGRRRDPNNPLNPNYKYVPVAYHSRASSVRESNVRVRRPSGQRKDANEAAPSFGPCRKLDYELELAVWIGPGNRQGEPVPISAAGDQIFGLGLVNSGRRATSSSGRCRPWGHFSARISAARSRPGSSPPRRWRRSG
jgi:fumarylacetoacetase